MDVQEKQQFKLVYERAHAVAYLRARAPYTYAIYLRIFNEIKMRLPDFKPEGVLVFGAGLGSAIWAMEEKLPPKRIAAVEPQSAMRKMGKFVTKEVLGQEKVLWVDALTMVPGIGGDRGKFDIVVLGQVLQEVQNANQR